MFLSLFVLVGISSAIVDGIARKVNVYRGGVLVGTCTANQDTSANEACAY